MEIFMNMFELYIKNMNKNIYLYILFNNYFSFKKYI